MKFREYECHECGKTFKATRPAEKGPCCSLNGGKDDS